MTFEFTIHDVSAAYIMDVAKVVATSPYPIKRGSIIQSFKRHENYTTRAIIQCIQLKLIKEIDSGYVCTQPMGDSIKRAKRSQLLIYFRQALQQHPPFLLYADFLTKGYDSEEAAQIVKGILGLTASEKNIQKSLKNWGKKADLIVEEKGKLRVPEAENGLPSKYIQNLLDSLKVEFKTNIFLIETMGTNSFAYLSNNNISIEGLVSSLLNFESDSKQSANKSSQVFEHFLFKLAKDNDVDTSKCNGVIELVNAIRSKKKILKNMVHISTGLGAIRNMSHHDPDKETEIPWNFTPQGALITSLLVPTTIGSIYSKISEDRQEF